MIYPLEKCYLTTGVFSETHRGVDLGWKSYGIVDPKVVAIEDGIVVESAYYPDAGNVVSVKHDVGGLHYCLSRYVHLKTRNVAKGASVRQGQQIGIGGNTGTNSQGAHLHLETWVCPNSFVYTNVYDDRVGAVRKAYTIDPRLLMFTSWKGTGFRNMELTNYIQPLCYTNKEGLNYRAAPGLKSITLGQLAVGKKYPIIGITNEIDGLRWGQVIVNDKVVYVSMYYLVVEESTKTVEIVKEVVREVESPVDVFGDIGGFHITIQRDVIK